MASAWVTKKGKRPDGTWTRVGLTSRAGKGTRRKPATEPQTFVETRWEVRLRRGGRGTKTESAGTFKTKPAALQRLARVQADLAAGRDPLAPQAESTGPTLREVMAETLEARRPTLSANTVRNWNRGLALLGELGDMPVEQIGWRDLERWHFDNLNLKPKVRGIFFLQYRFALDRCELPVNPARDARLKWAGPRPRPRATGRTRTTTTGSLERSAARPTRRSRRCSPA